MLVSVQWGTFPMGGKHFGADVFDIRAVPGSPCYEATSILLVATPTHATSPPTLEIEICQHDSGIFFDEQLVCSNHLKLLRSPAPFSRSFIQIYKAYNRPISAAGGSILLPGPFPADGLSLRFKTDFAMIGEVKIDFRQVAAKGIAIEREASLQPPPLATPACDPECVCKSLLWGHDRDCPMNRDRR